MLARDAAKTVTARVHRVASEINLDVVPVREGLGDFAMRRLVGRAQILQRRVGENDTPPEGIEGTIALENADRPFRKAPLGQDSKVQPGRSATNASYAHLTCLHFDERRGRIPLAVVTYVRAVTKATQFRAVLFCLCLGAALTL